MNTTKLSLVFLLLLAQVACITRAQTSKEIGIIPDPSPTPEIEESGPKAVVLKYLSLAKNREFGELAPLVNIEPFKNTQPLKDGHDAPNPDILVKITKQRLIEGFPRMIATGELRPIQTIVRMESNDVAMVRVTLQSSLESTPSTIATFELRKFAKETWRIVYIEQEVVGVG